MVQTTYLVSKITTERSNSVTVVILIQGKNINYLHFQDIVNDHDSITYSYLYTINS